MIEILTYTSLNRFLNCRKKFFFRDIACLVRSGYEVPALKFGAAIHEGLHQWKTIRSWDVPATEELWPYYDAAMCAYAEWYYEESFTILASEEKFEATIRNPKTGRPSRSFKMMGRIDGRTDQLIIEHKTTSATTAGYLEKLWTDRQIMLYTMYLRQNGLDIRGVLYDIIQKSNLRPRKNESPEAFRKRLDEQYADGQMFHRELLYFSNDDLARVEWEVWELTQQILDCKRRNVWYNNPSHCFHWSRACQYYPICKSRISRC